MSEETYGAGSIRIIDFVESVRLRPGMYFGNVDDGSAVTQVIHELVSNVLDLFLGKLATQVSVMWHDGYLEVRDDGPGIPFERDHEGESEGLLMLTVPHFTPSADGKAPHVHLHQIHGVGVAAVVAASRRLECWSWRDGARWFQAYQQGRPVDVPRVVEHGSGQGTLMRVQLDPELFSVTRPCDGAVRTMLEDAVHLYPGFRAQLHDEVFFAPHGLLDLALHDDRMDPLHRERWGERPGFSIYHEGEEFSVHAAILGYAPSTLWMTWLNGIRSVDHGIHKDGLERVLQACGWSPSVAMLNVTGQHPRYANPTKDRVAHLDAWEHIEDVLSEALGAYCARHDV